MSQIDAQDSNPPFTSLEAIRAVNDELLDAHDQQGDTDAVWVRAEALVRCTRQTGALPRRQPKSSLSATHLI